MTKKTSSSFDVGDMAVYPAHGVGQIEAIETRDVGELQQVFYVIRIVDTNMVVMVPTTSSSHVGLRSIINADEVDNVYSILREKDVVITARPWNQRYREYMEKIKTGSVYEIAEVLRDLYALQEDKTLSFGERKMMDTAQSLLVKEISIADQINEEAVSERITHIFD
ncbi:MAG TPA: CarD family transcriptional regulator [Desulfobacterales bacterium]|nr:CarD family transcriptional regulator [Desulfobacterales bacterium]